MAAMAMMAAICGCDVKAESTASAAVPPAAQAKVAGPTYTERIKIDDV